MRSQLRFIKWRPKVWVASILIFSAFCSGLRLEIGTIGISMSHLLIPIILTYHAARWSHNKTIFRISISGADVLLLCVWLISMISTFLFSGLPMRSITGALNLTSFLVLFFICKWTFRELTAQQLFSTLVQSAKLAAWFGVLCLVIAWSTGANNLGATFDHINKFNVASVAQAIPSIRSFSIEPNLFGITTGAVLSIVAAIYLTDIRGARITGAFAILGLAFFLSYTRSAFVGLAMAFLVMVFVSKRKAVLSRLLAIGLLAVFTLAVILVLLPDESSFKKAVYYKMGFGLFDFSTGTAIPRLVSMEEAWRGFKQSPLIGNGIFSANNVFVNPHTGEVTGTAGPVGWLNGLFFQALHDTGMFGLICWFFFFAFFLFQNFNVYRLLPNSIERSMVLGFLGGNIVILVGSQASSVVWISFPFVYWAINLALLQYCKTQLRVNS